MADVWLAVLGSVQASSNIIELEREAEKAAMY
jgi:hypothetical protein